MENTLASMRTALLHLDLMLRMRVKFGDEENVVAARIDNDWEYREKATNTKYQWEDKNFNANYGGINKNVFLHVTAKVYQTLPLFTHLRDDRRLYLCGQFQY